jgi:hypothetical protein
MCIVVDTGKARDKLTDEAGAKADAVQPAEGSSPQDDKRRASVEDTTGV